MDLTLVTTMRPPAVRWLPAFQQICAMVSRASAASLAKWTLPPTASSRCLNCSTSSGNRSWFASRRCVRSARPFAKSKLSKALSRLALSPVMAWISARSRSGSLSALLTRREKWRRVSGTRRRGFLQGFYNRARGRHWRQAYCSDAHDGALVATRIDDRIRMSERSGARELRVGGRHLDRVTRAVERSSKDRRHQAVLPRQRRYRFEGAAGARQVRRGGIAGQYVELDERHGGDRVFNQRLDPFGQAPELVAACMVEVAARVRIAISLVDVRGQVHGRRQPSVSETSLVGAQRGPETPDLVGQLASDSLCMIHARTSSVLVTEKAIQQLGRALAKSRPVAAPCRIEVRDRESGIPRGVDAAVHVGPGSLGALVRIHRVVVLVRVLAAGIEPGLRVAEHAVEVAGRGVEHRVHAGKG